MKTIIVSPLGLAALSLLPSCTTTTSQVSPATYGTVETKTTRTD